jgi:hypothetical protein
LTSLALIAPSTDWNKLTVLLGGGASPHSHPGPSLTSPKIVVQYQPYPDAGSYARPIPIAPNELLSMLAL